MRKFTTISLGVIVSLISIQAEGQKVINPETDTIKWEYTRLENMVKREKINLSGYFISYSDKSFLWIQTGVDRKYSFDVKSVKGDWADVTGKGELIYHVTCNGEEGTLKMHREQGELKIILDFIQPDKRTPYLVLQIDGYTKI